MEMPKAHLEFQRGSYGASPVKAFCERLCVSFEAEPSNFGHGGERNPSTERCSDGDFLVTADKSEPLQAATG